MRVYPPTSYIYIYAWHSLYDLTTLTFIELVHAQSNSTLGALGDHTSLAHVREVTALYPYNLSGLRHA